MYGCNAWLNFSEGLENGPGRKMEKKDESERVLEAFWLATDNVSETGNVQDKTYNHDSSEVVGLLSSEVRGRLITLLIELDDRLFYK